jgi:deoxyribodipyrimidine photo-lyase
MAGGVGVQVVFNLVPDFPGANLRHYSFMLKGLAEVEAQLQQLSIPFFLLQGDAAETVPAFAARNGASLVVMDFSPLRIGR